MSEQLTINHLNVQQTAEMFKFVAKAVIDKKPFLTEIDSAIGDGDHGIGMAIGFEEVIKTLTNTSFSTVNELFKETGMSMLSTMGGASGVIFGTLFISGTKNLSKEETLKLEWLADAFEESLQAIKKRGKADVGDKTMIDALAPAVAALKESAVSGRTLLDGIKAAETAAQQGVEDTKNYTAKFGRAKFLGERAIGHQDAGATSVWLIFQAMRTWMEGNEA